MIDELKPLLKRFIVFAKDNLNFQKPPRLFLRQDTANQKCMLGKTAHYDPQNRAVTLYISGRHPKDILRSFAHELVHHCQNERGDLAPEKMKTMNVSYAQENPHMRKMEKEAYLIGNMCLRDWEDGLDDKLQYKMKLAEQKFLKENKTMSVKISKKELKNLIQKLLESKLKEDSCGSREDKKKKGYMEEGDGCGGCGKSECAECNPLEENEELEEASGNARTSKHDDNPALKGDQHELPDHLQQGIIAAAGDEEPEKQEESKKKDTKSKEDAKKKVKNKTILKFINKKDLEDLANSGSTPEEDAAAFSGGKSERKPEKSSTQKESKIQTPEQENALYESRFTKRNTRLFEKLLKEWTK